MVREALFVDAGYLLAGVHDLLGGTTSRSAFDCDYESLVPEVRHAVEAHAGDGSRFLRTYWYDGAKDGIPTADHRRIANLAYVKLRLGRLNMRGQQKGVDGLIYRDLTALARAGAIERAYLFTGDEDMRESVATTQDMGVQVVLMSFSPTRQTGRSAALVQEADEVLVLDEEFWTPHFTAVEAPPAATAPESSAVATAAKKFAAEWASGASKSEIVALLDQAPTVPKDLFVQLLLEAETSLGSLRTYPEAKRALRGAFWDEIKALNKASAGLSPDAEVSPLGAHATDLASTPPH